MIALPDEVANNAVDFVFLIFVLSAIAPESVGLVFEKLHKSLKPGGVILFR